MTVTDLSPTVASSDRRPPRILVVDDERSMRELLAIVLRREGYEVLLAENGRAAVDTLEREPVDLLISDIKMPDLSGVEVLRAAKRIDQDILGIMITAFASTDSAVEAMRLGACDYLSKPFDIDLLKMKVREKIENRQLRQENVLLKRTLGLSHQFSNIIGRSDAMLEVFKMIETVARTNSTILLTGESGTGKGLVAQAIHFHSLRRERPIVALNCGALPEALLESELFGHMRGSFTGADSNKKGLLEVAEKGTVFLDEIGEMSAVMQVKLLRVLQERRFRRVGGLEELQADIRVIAATNQDLNKLVADGRFREDLFYRINVIPISLPPLRERREDIPLLAEHFLMKYNEQMGKTISGISQQAMELLVDHDWPGNIRELENVLERAVALEHTPAILSESLPPAVRGDGVRNGASAAVDSLPEGGFDLEAHVKQIERGYIAQALERAGGVQVKAAELLGMSFRSFRYYAKKYNLRDGKGFTLVELLVVVAILGIIAAIAIPGLLRARMSGNEASAIGTIRVVNSAELSYSTSCAQGFAEDLAELAKPPASGGQSFVSPDLSAPVGTSIAKTGYAITYTATGAPIATANGSCTVANNSGPKPYFGYTLIGDPLAWNTTGSRNFGTSERQTIYYVQNNVSTTVLFNANGTSSNGAPLK